MYNWSIDTKKLKQNSKLYIRWKLTQMINYGLDGEKIDKKELIMNWKYIKNHLDPNRRKFIEFILWSKQY